MSLEYGHRSDANIDEICCKTERLAETLWDAHSIVFDQDIDYERDDQSGGLAYDLSPEVRKDRRNQRLKMFESYHEDLMRGMNELDKIRRPLLLQTFITAVRKHVYDMTHYMTVLSKQKKSDRIVLSAYVQRENYFRDLIAKILHERPLVISDETQRITNQKKISTRRMPSVTFKKTWDMNIAAAIKTTYTGRKYTPQNLEADHFLPFSEVMVELRSIDRKPAGVLISQDIGPETYIREFMPNRPRADESHTGFGKALQKMISESKWRGRRIIVEVPEDDITSLQQLSDAGFLAKSILYEADEPDRYVLEYVPPETK